jgi:hypothetical protein
MYGRSCMPTDVGKSQTRIVPASKRTGRTHALDAHEATKLLLLRFFDTGPIVRQRTDFAAHGRQPQLDIGLQLWHLLSGLMGWIPAQIPPIPRLTVVRAFRVTWTTLRGGVG